MSIVGARGLEPPVRSSALGPSANLSRHPINGFVLRRSVSAATAGTYALGSFGADALGWFGADALGSFCTNALGSFGAAC